MHGSFAFKLVWAISQWVMLGINVEMLVGLYAKCVLFLTDFNQKCKKTTNFSKEYQI
jgi:hypothetical protein